MIILGIILLLVVINAIRKTMNSKIVPPTYPDSWLKKYNDVPKSKPYKAD